MKTDRRWWVVGLLAASVAGGLGLRGELTLPAALAELARQDATLNYVAIPPDDTPRTLALTGAAMDVLPALATAFGCQAYDHAGLWVVAAAPGFDEAPGLWQAQLTDAQRAYFERARVVARDMPVGVVDLEADLERGRQESAEFWQAFDADLAAAPPAPMTPAGVLRPVTDWPHSSAVFSRQVAEEAALAVYDVPARLPGDLLLRLAALPGKDRRTQLCVQFAALGGMVVLQPGNVYDQPEPTPEELVRPSTLEPELIPAWRSSFLGQMVTLDGEGSLGQVAAEAMEQLGCRWRGGDERDPAVVCRARAVPLWLALDSLSIAAGRRWAPELDSREYGWVEAEGLPDLVYATAPLAYRAGDLHARRIGPRRLPQLASSIWHALTDSQRRGLSEGQALPLMDLSPAAVELCALAFQSSVASYATARLRRFSLATTRRLSGWAVLSRAGVVVRHLTRDRWGVQSGPLRAHPSVVDEVRSDLSDSLMLWAAGSRVHGRTSSRESQRDAPRQPIAGPLGPDNQGGRP